MSWGVVEPLTGEAAGGGGYGQQLAGRAGRTLKMGVCLS